MNEMSNLSLLAVSPIDGRYSRQTEPLREYFSEYALIKYRVRIEIEYFIALCEIPLPQLADFDKTKFEALRDIYRNMTPEDAAKVKDIEKVTNHDVKAVEYFIKDRFKEMDIMKWESSFISDLHHRISTTLLSLSHSRKPSMRATCLS